MDSHENAASMRNRQPRMNRHSQSQQQQWKEKLLNLMIRSYQHKIEKDVIGMVVEDCDWNYDKCHKVLHDMISDNGESNDFPQVEELLKLSGRQLQEQYDEMNRIEREKIRRDRINELFGSSRSRVVHKDSMCGVKIEYRPNGSDPSDLSSDDDDDDDIKGGRRTANVKSPQLSLPKVYNYSKPSETTGAGTEPAVFDLGNSLLKMKNDPSAPQIFKSTLFPSSESALAGTHTPARKICSESATPGSLTSGRNRCIELARSILNASRESILAGSHTSARKICTDSEIPGSFIPGRNTCIGLARSILARSREPAIPGPSTSAQTPGIGLAVPGPPRATNTGAIPKRKIPFLTNPPPAEQMRRGNQPQLPVRSPSLKIVGRSLDGQSGLSVRSPCSIPLPSARVEEKCSPQLHIATSGPVRQLPREPPAMQLGVNRNSLALQVVAPMPVLNLPQLPGPDAPAPAKAVPVSPSIIPDVSPTLLARLQPIIKHAKEQMKIREMQKAEELKMREMQKAEELKMREMQKAEELKMREMQKAEELKMREMQKAEEMKMREMQKAEEMKRIEESLTSEQRYVEVLINKGYKVLIFMRGCPGSGKSYLAKQIVERTVGGSPADYIFSTDDYFIKVNEGEYRFDPKLLSTAHSFNKNRARIAAKKGLSPIIIDNTNTRSWEMEDYLPVAVLSGYIVTTIEPSTHWKYDPKELFRRNQHNVPLDKIYDMLHRFERNIDGASLLRNARLSYPRGMRPPQMRSCPPILGKAMAPEQETVLDLPQPIEMLTAPPQPQRQELTRNFSVPKPAGNLKPTEYVDAIVADTKKEQVREIEERDNNEIKPTKEACNQNSNMVQELKTIGSEEESNIKNLQTVVIEVKSNLTTDNVQLINHVQLEKKIENTDCIENIDCVENTDRDENTDRVENTDCVENTERDANTDCVENTDCDANTDRVKNTDCEVIDIKTVSRRNSQSEMDSATEALFANYCRFIGFDTTAYDAMASKSKNTYYDDDMFSSSSEESLREISEDRLKDTEKKINNDESIQQDKSELRVVMSEEIRNSQITNPGNNLSNYGLIMPLSIKFYTESQLREVESGSNLSLIITPAYCGKVRLGTDIELAGVNQLDIAPENYNVEHNLNINDWEENEDASSRSSSSPPPMPFFEMPHQINMKKSKELKDNCSCPRLQQRESPIYAEDIVIVDRPIDEQVNSDLCSGVNDDAGDTETLYMSTVSIPDSDRFLDGYCSVSSGSVCSDVDISEYDLCELPKQDKKMSTEEQEEENDKGEDKVGGKDDEEKEDDRADDDDENCEGEEEEEDSTDVRSFYGIYEYLKKSILWEDETKPRRKNYNNDGSSISLYNLINMEGLILKDEAKKNKDTCESDFVVYQDEAEAFVALNMDGDEEFVRYSPEHFENIDCNIPKAADEVPQNIIIDEAVNRVALELLAAQCDPMPLPCNPEMSENDNTHELLKPRQGDFDFAMSNFPVNNQVEENHVLNPYSNNSYEWREVAVRIPQEERRPYCPVIPDHGLQRVVELVDQATNTSTFTVYDPNVHRIITIPTPKKHIG